MDELDEDLDALETEVRELLERVKDIDRQLAIRKPAGRVSNGEYRDYCDWRKSALHARAIIEAQYREKKAQLKAERRAANAALHEYAQETDPAAGIIKDLIRVAVACRAYENPAHAHVIQRAKAYLGQEGYRPAVGGDHG